MKFTLATGAIFVAIDKLDTLSIGQSFSAPEPIWLAVWGIVLIVFSGALRSRSRTERVAVSQPATAQVNVPCTLERMA